MDEPVVRSMVATAVAAAVMLGLFELITPCQSGVVWAQEKKAEEKKKEEKKQEAGVGFTCRVRQTQRQSGAPKPTEITEMVRESPQYGYRIDYYGQGKLTISSYRNYADGTTVTLHHAGMMTKVYTRQQGPKGPPPAGPYDPRPRIKKALAGAHKKLGRRTIDGVEAEGIEVPEISGMFGGARTGGSGGMGGPGAGGRMNGAGSGGKVSRVGNAPSGSGVSAASQLWCAVDTGLPILVEENLVVGKDGYRMKRISDQFRWDVRFDPNEFKAEIPPDYQLADVPQPGRGGGAGGAFGGSAPR